VIPSRRRKRRRKSPERRNEPRRVTQKPLQGVLRLITRGERGGTKKKKIRTRLRVTKLNVTLFTRETRTLAGEIWGVKTAQKHGESLCRAHTGNVMKLQRKPAEESWRGGAKIACADS